MASYKDARAKKKDIIGSRIDNGDLEYICTPGCAFYMGETRPDFSKVGWMCILCYPSR